MFIVLLVVIILGLIANQLSNIHLNFILIILICTGIAYILRLLKNLYEYCKKQKEAQKQIEDLKRIEMIYIFPKKFAFSQSMAINNC